ncbi:MAG TPA: hypothetical protein VHE34_19855 [Puia sp.]|uniref:hypothetical protein n=1 Tax=Puia sp. TaxID=2045100 RepID=UPI002C7D83C3|nr:hypothetical protein [Puia sp.]HVU97493.1 hypothetical protein [Puia sp.]
MRKLHCLLVGILLLIGQGLRAQTTEVSGKITDHPTDPPFFNSAIPIDKTIKGRVAAVTLIAVLNTGNNSLNEMIATGVTLLGQAPAGDKNV